MTGIRICLAELGGGSDALHGTLSSVEVLDLVTPELRTEGSFYSFISIGCSFHDDYGRGGMRGRSLSCTPCAVRRPRPEVVEYVSHTRDKTPSISPPFSTATRSKLNRVLPSSLHVDDVNKQWPKKETQTHPTQTHLISSHNNGDAEIHCPFASREQPTGFFSHYFVFADA